MSEKSSTPKRAVRSKTERFEIAAMARMLLVLDQLSMLAELGNAGRFEYTPEQVSKIFDSIDSGVAAARLAFSTSTPSGKPKFSFD